MNFKEQYYINKEIHKTLSEKYEAFNDKAFKLIPILTFVLGIYGYLIKDWLLVEFKKCNDNHCIVIIMFLIAGLVIIDSFIILIFVYMIIKPRPLTIIKLQKEFNKILEISPEEDVYEKLSNEYIDSYEKTYNAVTEKSRFLEWTYKGMALLVFLSLVFFTMYIFYNLTS